MLVSKVGEVENTKLLVPVVPVTEASRLAAVIVETKFLLASVATIREAVRPDKLIVPLEVNPVSPLTTPAEVISQILEFMATVPPPPPMVTVPVEVPVLILVAKLEEALILKIPPEKV